MIISLLTLSLAHAAPTWTESVYCPGEAPCTVVRSSSAGTDAEGLDLWVIELVRAAVPPGTPYESLLEPTYGPTPCLPMEVHRLRTRGGELVDSLVLAEVCNDGYGAAGMGEDSFVVGPNRFTHGQHGGSSWRWSKGESWQLSPFELVEQSESLGWTLAPVESGSSWSWETRSGSATRSAPQCDNEEAAVVEARWLALPQASTEDWREGAGPCALHLDSGGEHGFIVHGEAGAADDARLTLRMDSPEVLVVEVRDDTWVDTATSWVLTDHLELWTGEPMGVMDHCVDPAAAVQWGVGMDGVVHPGFGEPAATDLSAEVHRVGRARIFRVQFATPPEGLTVVYSDSDDGKSQERLVASSDLRFGDARSLGTVFDTGERGAACVAGAVSP